MAIRNNFGKRVPLCDAPFRFGSAALRRKLDAADAEQNSAVPQPQPSAAEILSLSPEARTKLVFSQIGEITAGWASRTQTIVSLQEELLLKLRTEKLLAVGYPTHKENADQPEPIPKFLFQMPYANWSKSIFEGQRRRYELVEVFSPPVASPTIADPNASAAISRQHQAREQPRNPKKRGVGRPNVRGKVMEIALEIIGNANSPTWKFRNELWKQIREIGKIRYPDDFDDYRPKEQSMRSGINDALKLRPHLAKHYKL